MRAMRLISSSIICRLPSGRAVWRALISDDAHRSLDDGQGIIDFVGHPRRDLAHRGQTFALNELLLRLLQSAIGLLKALFLLGHALPVAQQRGAHLLKGTGQIADLVLGIHLHGTIIRALRKPWTAATRCPTGRETRMARMIASDVPQTIAPRLSNRRSRLV